MDDEKGRKMANPVAEIMDTFFNGRPAPKDSPDKIHVHLTPVQMAALELGKSLRFKAAGASIIIVPPHTSANR
jgi:hypothetical protein